MCAMYLFVICVSIKTIWFQLNEIIPNYMMSYIYIYILYTHTYVYMYVCIYLCVFNMVLITGPNGPTSWTGHQSGLEKIPKIGKNQLKTFLHLILFKYHLFTFKYTHPILFKAQEYLCLVIFEKPMIQVYGKTILSMEFKSIIKARDSNPWQFTHPKPNSHW